MYVKRHTYPFFIYKPIPLSLHLLMGTDEIHVKTGHSLTFISK